MKEGSLVDKAPSLLSFAGTVLRHFLHGFAEGPLGVQDPAVHRANQLNKEHFIFLASLCHFPHSFTFASWDYFPNKSFASQFLSWVLL